MLGYAVPRGQTSSVSRQGHLEEPTMEKIAFIVCAAACILRDR